MGTARPLFGFALVALALLSGCGGEVHDATSKELSALTAEISKLRADQAALAERLDAMERAKSPAAAPAADAAKPADSAPPPVVAARSLDSDRPSLDVVKLGPPPSEEGDGDIDAEGPRTVLRSGANGIVVEEQGAAGGTTRTVVTDPSKKAGTSKKSDKTDRKKTASLPTP
jgi:outer membrane murein-binding lipoprotein Lpp